MCALPLNAARDHNSRSAPAVRPRDLDRGESPPNGEARVNRQTRRRRIGLIGGLLALIAVVAAVPVYRAATALPKRFAPVVEGQLYRSGAVSARQLHNLRERYGIKRVISLLDSQSPECIDERAAAERLGIEWHNVPMRGDGTSTAEQRRELMALLDDQGGDPTLVHCAAGANRTGLAIGLYRIDHDGWTYDQVLEEMKLFDFEDLPKHENLRAALRDAAQHPTTAPSEPSP